MEEPSEPHHSVSCKFIRLHGFMSGSDAAHVYVVSLTHCIPKTDFVSEEPV